MLRQAKVGSPDSEKKDEKLFTKLAVFTMKSVR